MDLFDAIEKRHSYRGGFKDMPIPREDLRRIVEAGLKAPFGKNQQTTIFVIIDDHDLLSEIRGMHAKNEDMQQAQAMIACVVDKQPEPVYEEFLGWETPINDIRSYDRLPANAQRYLARIEERLYPSLFFY